MLTKHGVLSIDGVLRSVAIRNIERMYDENPIVTVEVINTLDCKPLNKDVEMLKAIDRRRESPIKNVIFNYPATIVVWNDGTKTVVKCQPDDAYNRETGLAMCIAKKFLGNKGNFNEVFKKWIPEYNEISTEKMRSHLIAFCDDQTVCDECVLNENERCGHGVHFKTKNIDDEYEMSDEEIKDAYNVVFGEKKG